MSVAYIDGDNLLPRINELSNEGELFQNIDKKIPLSDSGYTTLTANAYLGAWGIKEALDNGVTWETKRYEAYPPEPHFYAFFDKKGRMMGIACHNTDIGDGWEDSEVHNDSPAIRLIALQMGANILEYAFTY